MKKAKKNFVVEYKGVRRKPTPQSNSIWGSVDLRQFAEKDGNVEAFLIDRIPAGSGPGMLEIPRAAAVTADLRQQPTSNFPPEGQIADETSVTEEASTELQTALPKVPEPKKRGPGAKKAAPETATLDASVEAPAVKKPRAKRGNKNVAAEVKPSARRGGRKAKAAVEAIVDSALQPESSVTAAGEEMEDLLQLEQENQRLRKLLTEKLRAENAGLRKRLGFN